MASAEIVGLVGSAFALIAFLFKNIIIIRSISIVGCSIFIAYGVLINSLIIWALNVILIVIHTIYLTVEIVRKKGKNAPQDRETDTN